MDRVVQGEGRDDEQQTEDHRIANEPRSLTALRMGEDLRRRILVHGTHALGLQFRGLYVTASSQFSDGLKTKNPGRALRQHRPGVSDQIVHEANA